MTDAALPEFSFTDDVRRRILNDFVECLCQACRVFQMKLEYVEYSERELNLAVDEAEIDIRAMFARRSKEDGIAPGKIAGIVAFRLSRFKIVHFHEEGWNNSFMHLVQELAAVFLVNRVFVKRLIPEKSVMELSYQLSRRHANQETAGLFFDVFAPNMDRVA